MGRPNPSNVECEDCGDAPDEASHRPGARKLCDRCRAKLKKEVMQHTPTPFQALKGGPSWTPIIGADARLVAQPHPRDADFIVLACNSHDPLVDALKKAAGELNFALPANTPVQVIRRVEEALATIRAALALPGVL